MMWPMHVAKKVLSNQASRFTGIETNAVVLFAHTLQEVFIDEDTAFTSVFTLDDATNNKARVKVNLLLLSTLEVRVYFHYPASEC
ncbi:hypothetical protein CYMTET_42459 [Cymbomonas tetramitiformis]|uniref:Uncharacterized protein n=1 Tax=Cymbomonas tetramitiformis TaxID=36881 RepID=A0AAE0F1H7_9CHLO|nr:hypothetical protein CYMTET_42459 [Cymbomonas tetramitiformis]